MDGNSMNVVDDRMERLKDLLPEVFSEGKIDWEKLRLTLGEDVNISDERYVLNWAGKSDSFRVLQTTTTATLEPAKDESINFDSTENIFIEGENLEVLKVLQKAYYGKIKMIYIDPPYNTGKESFIYPDKFSESREDYLKRINSMDELGYLLTEGNFQKNSRDNGHYHSNWLSMMYPRLFLARNLLKKEGVIFVSIDDHEVHNLRLLMNAIYGEENFIAQFVWEGALKNDSKFVSVSHDYILCYARDKNELKINDQEWRTRKEGIDAIYQKVEELNEEYQEDFSKVTEELKEWFSTLDKNHPSWQHKHYDTVDNRGVYFPGDISAESGRDRDPYDVFHPRTGKPVKVPERGWPTKKFMSYLLEDDRVHFGDDETTVPNRKFYLHETEGQVLPSVIYKDRRGAMKRLKDMLGGIYFDNPKDEDVIMKLIEAATQEDDIILDFFAGSGTTAHSVYKINSLDDSTRSYILVQFPEALDKDNKDQKAAYEFCVSLGLPPNIAELCKERIRRTISQKTFQSEDFDNGLKVFRLNHSNYKLWRGDGIKTEEELLNQLELLEVPVRKEAQEENMLFELLLKAGFPLTTHTEKREVDSSYYYLVDEELAVVLSHLGATIVEDILQAAPRQVICLDSLFAGDDAFKTNTQLQFKEAGIAFQSI